MFKSVRNRRGMTLIEIMIVLAILGGIAALLLPRFTGSLDKAKVREAKIQIGQVISALSMYYTDCGKYPQSLEGLSQQDANCANWGPEAYAKDKQLKDPWGNPFAYEVTGSDFVIKSLGKDGAEGGSGYDADISSEDME
ncbi:MAG: type II secretion system major pseudopilin GspG [Bdellovibrionia bacterium]